jgi:hypothetical protein
MPSREGGERERRFSLKILDGTAVGRIIGVIALAVALVGGTVVAA